MNLAAGGVRTWEFLMCLPAPAGHCFFLLYRIDLKQATVRKGCAQDEQASPLRETGPYKIEAHEQHMIHTKVSNAL